MKSVLCVYKPLGFTPLQMIRTVQQTMPEYAHSRIGFAGRLDPTAEGLLLLLIDEENKKKKMYEALPKTYEFEVLFGVSTDTYDTLGKVINTQRTTNHKQLTSEITKLIPSFLGKRKQPYPPYSSRTVQGKPLYWYARNGTLGDIRIPVRDVELYSLELLSTTLLPNKNFEQSVMHRIQLVSGAFRQDEIRLSWQSYFDSPPLPADRQAYNPVFRFRVACSSGTYVRSLANSMGEKLGIPSLAYSIKRTAIGPYTLKHSLTLDPIAN